MYRNTIVSALFLLLVNALLSQPVTAQAQDSGGEQQVTSDREAERILKEVRAEQTRFERIRRANLPWTYSRGGYCDTGAGDERIGRFCLMHGGDGKDYEPPPEPEAVVSARARLLDKLNDAATHLPWDGWIAGQRIRYMLETGDAETAAILAHGCAAAEWWCASLTGYVHHFSGNAVRADSAYGEALRLMPETERERWLDLSMMLEGRTLSAYRRLDGEEKQRFEERFWRLSRLHFTRPGNDLRSEHLSRNVLSIFQDRAQSTDGIPWGDDLREILVRYGWPRGWERVRETHPGRTGGSPSLISYYSTSRAQLLPPHEVLFPTTGGGLTEGEWDVESRRPRTGYNLPTPLASARWLRRLDHQFAVFRRPEGAVVIAAYSIPADSLPDAHVPLRSALAIARADEEPGVTEFPTRGFADAVIMQTEPGPALLSIEILSVEANRAARARLGVELPRLQQGTLALSDILLLGDPDVLPDSLTQAASLARGSDRLAAGERVGVYWEIYGLPEEEIQSLAVSLRLVNRRSGWLRRAAERIGVVGEDAPIRLRWQEQASSIGHVARALAIEIPRVSPGSYVLELSVERAGEEPVVVERTVEVVDGE
ncbi:hypothetical protein BH23GEM6_BH23GEM6_07320 [soil metagenome]